MDVREQTGDGKEMGEALAQEERERKEKEEEEEINWRLNERDIDGGFSGCEFPRLWPPRRFVHNGQLERR